jgi:hypothetical protein
VRAFAEFVKAADDDDRKRILEDYPELLTPQAWRHIDQLVAAFGEKAGKESAAVLRAHQDLLRRCREVGSDAALIELASLPGRQLDHLDSRIVRMFSMEITAGGGSSPGDVGPIPGVMFDCPVGHDSPKRLRVVGQDPGMCPTHNVRRTLNGLPGQVW